jgi:hypothetical protein
MVKELRVAQTFFASIHQSFHFELCNRGELMPRLRAELLFKITIGDISRHPFFFIILMTHGKNPLTILSAQAIPVKFW